MRILLSDIPPSSFMFGNACHQPLNVCNVLNHGCKLKILRNYYLGKTINRNLCSHSLNCSHTAYETSMDRNMIEKINFHMVRYEQINEKQD